MKPRRSNGCRKRRAGGIFYGTIEHHPDSPVTSIKEASIAESGNSLVRSGRLPAGAQEKWLALREANPRNAALLGNLAKFFQMSDKNPAESALLQARHCSCKIPEWEWRLGISTQWGFWGWTRWA